jgi:hypothetical protein
VSSTSKQQRTAPFGVYWLLGSDEWADDQDGVALKQVVDRLYPKGHKIQLVALVIDNDVQTAAAIYPADQEEPTVEQVARIRDKLIELNREPTQVGVRSGALGS